MKQHTPPAFNLLDEPWIPVRTRQGAVQEVSLSDALLHAQDFAALAETSPPNLVALYRVLLAVLHRALTTQHGRWHDADRARWFKQGLPEAPLRAYLAQWRERFWLFHPQQPFMQVAALADAEETKDKRKPWTQISLEGASGNTPVVFDHCLDDAPTAIDKALACRNLLGYLQFTPGGLVKTFRDADKAGALSNTAAVIPHGNTLTETLLLSLHPWDSLRPNDHPAWELPPPAIAALCDPPTLATGPNDRYTRLSRAVLLLPTDDGQHIRHIRFGAGLGLEDDANAHDPMACYRITKEDKQVRLTYAQGRALWRELPALVPDVTGKQNLPAAVLSWSANLYNALGQWDAPIQILTAGLASDQAKLLLWRAERIELPAAFLLEPDAAANLRQQMQQVESVYVNLRGVGASAIAATMPDPQHKDTRSRARAMLDNGPTAAVYFSGVERQLPQLMQQLAQSDLDQAQLQWNAALAGAVSQAWLALGHSLGASPAVLRALARAQSKIGYLLHTLQPSSPQNPLSPLAATSVTLQESTP